MIILIIYLLCALLFGLYLYYANKELCKEDKMDKFDWVILCVISIDFPLFLTIILVKWIIFSKNKKI